MRVLHIIHSLTFGGVESGTMRLAAEQAKTSDHSVTILCVGSTLGDRLSEIPSSVVVKHIAIRDSSKFKFLQLVRVLRFAIHFILYLRKNKFDLIHCHLNLINMLILILTKMSFLSPRFICNAYTTHNIFKDKIGGEIFRYLSQYVCFKYADVCASDSPAGWSYCFGEKPSHRRIIVPMPISLIRNLERSNSKPSALNHSSLIIGNIGRHIPQKNQSFLIDLLKESKNRGFDWRLIIVGSGDLRQDLVQKIADFDLDSRIEIREPVNNLDSFYNEIDIFILPSLSESLPVTLLEAQSFGVRCITSSMVSKDASLIPFLVDFVDLGGGLDIWIDSILRCARINYSDDAIAELLLDSGLDTIQVCQRWDTLYNV